MRARLLLTSILVVLLCTAALGRSWYINPDGTGCAPTIQAAIDCAEAGDEIILTDGIYTGDGNRDIDFSGKSIVVRSEGSNPANCVIDCEGTELAPHRGFHFHNEEISTSVVEGLTIRNGYACGEWPSYGGGGILCYYFSSPMIRNCIIEECIGVRGGGLYCFQNSSPDVMFCAFMGDSARSGGAMFCEYWSSPWVEGCVFLGNSADLWDITNVGGGALACLYSSPTLSGCLFARNVGYDGGAVRLAYSSPSFASCTFVDNVAVRQGAGVYCYLGAYPTIDRTIFAYCTSAAYGPVTCAVTSENGPVLTCCAMWDNPPSGAGWTGCVQEQNGINGNFADVPRFCSREDSCYNLQECSPCVCAGSCGQIGAYGVGCECWEDYAGIEPPPSRATTWGAIKSMYR